MTPPVLIWGAGAIGGTVGAFLARAGVSVVFVDVDAAHVQAMRNDGLAIEGPVANFRTGPLPAFLPGEVAETFRRVFLCVKAHHTAAAVAELAPHLTEEGYVLSLQNGLNELEIAAHVGEARTLGAVVLGELDGTMTPRLADLHELIRLFEPDAVASGSIWGFLWGKLGYSCLLHAEALVEESIADCLADPEYRPLLVALVREVIAVAAAQGVHPEGFNGYDPQAFRKDAQPGALEATFGAMIAYNRASAKTHSGVWRDLAVRRRKTAVDAQILPIATRAAELGVETPLVRRLVALIHDIEESRRPQARATLLALAEPHPDAG